VEQKLKKNRITVSLTQEEYIALSHLADQKDVSLSWIIRQAIKKYLEKDAEESQRQLELPFDIKRQPV
jgi:predicted transcriptional regulator